MKKLFFALLMALPLGVAAELREDAFIIRTTDGAAQGLLFGDVEKITFSNLDDEGVPHTGIFYQELHFPDTIIRTPVSEIAEVSFEKPRAKFQPNVVLGKETGLFDYLWSCTKTENGHVLVFDPLISMMMPKAGDILTYFDTDNEILGGPFAGKVLSIDWAMSGPGSYIVTTEMPDKIQDIYAELVGVEVLTNDSPGVEECLRRAKALPKDMPKSRVDGEGKHTIEFDIPIKYTYSGSDDDDEDWMGGSGTSTGKSFSISGGVKGSLELRLAYEFSKERNFLSVGTTYEYTPTFKLGFAAEVTWQKPFWNPTDFPIFDIIVTSAPIFSVTFGVAPFVKLSGSANITLEKTFATTRTRTLAYYNDGIYRSGRCNNNADDDDKGVEKEGLELSLNLEGSAMAGVNMGVLVGTTRIFKTGLGIIAEAYVGPKLSGTVGIIPTMPAGSDGPNTIAYNAMKNWNVSATWCAIDLSMSFYQEILGDQKKTQFADMSFAIDPFTVSLVPSFEAPNMELPATEEYEYWTTYWNNGDYTKMKVTLPRPDGLCLLPLHPGIAIYDEQGKYLSSWFYDELYWMPSADSDVFDNMEWDSDFRYMPNEKYKIYPAFEILTGKYWEEFRAEPARTVQYECLTNTDGSNVTHERTVSIDGVKYYDYKVHFDGSVNDNTRKCWHLQNIGFYMSENVTDFETLDYWTVLLKGTEIGSLDKSTFYCDFVTTLKPGTRYYYCAVAKYANVPKNLEVIRGEIKSFVAPIPEE